MEFKYTRWGSEQIHTLNENYMIKTMNIYSNKYISLQLHREKHEVWHVNSGSGIMFLIDKCIFINKGDIIEIPPFGIHQVQAIGEKTLSILEYSDNIQDGTVKLNDLSVIDNITKMGLGVKL